MAFTVGQCSVTPVLNNTSPLIATAQTATSPVSLQGSIWNETSSNGVLPSFIHGPLVVSLHFLKF